MRRIDEADTILEELLRLHPSEEERPEDPLGQVSRLKVILVTRAKGGQPSESDYIWLRQQLVTNRELKPLLPTFLVDCRTIREFWDFISARYSGEGSYRKRTAYVDSEFKPILDHLEGLDTVPILAQSAEPRNKTKETGGRSIDLLSQLRGTLTQDQSEMLNSIWADYSAKGEWTTCKRLHARFEGRLKVSEVRAALEDLGGCVVYETTDDRYALKFLGVMLTGAGPEWEKLCVRYLEYVFTKYREDPDVRLVSGREVQEALQLPPDVSRQLGQILAIGPLSGGSFAGAGTLIWSAGVPQDVDTLSEWKDLGLYLRREALKGYEKNVPITQHGLMRYWANKTGRLPSDFADTTPPVLAEPEVEATSPATPRKGRNSTPAAFFSYAHVDDKQDQKWLSKIRAQLEGEVGSQTGHDFQIFQDSAAIKWGQNWEQRITQAIEDEVIFLIPILTPSFFNSKACREELERFLERERRLRRNDLILPIYYIRCAPLEDRTEPKRDPLAQALSKRQRADLRELRHMSPGSQKVRKKLTELAEQIRDALEAMRGEGTSE